MSTFAARNDIHKGGGGIRRALHKAGWRFLCDAHVTSLLAVSTSCSRQQDDSVAPPTQSWSEKMMYCKFMFPAAAVPTGRGYGAPASATTTKKRRSPSLSPASPIGLHHCCRRPPARKLTLWRGPIGVGDCRAVMALAPSGREGCLPVGDWGTHYFPPTAMIKEV